MRDQVNRSRRRWAASLAAVAACFLIGAPAAYGAFDTNTTAAVLASAYTLRAPTGDAMSASCEQVGSSGKYRLRISVTATASEARANFYVLNLVSPNGAVTTVDLVAGAAQYDSGTSPGAARGTWNYSVQSQYRVPNSTNVWSSSATPSTIMC
ncbi:hypothetical protein [Paenarthrobacter sp. NPDC089316]|uniref:hypothetical protein n=1 Tax=unclassified Paenarthrobacter TaxID=2634190 RepID=UPI00341BDD19